MLWMCDSIWSNMKIVDLDINQSLFTLYKKWSFPLTISSVNVTKSAGNWVIRTMSLNRSNIPPNFASILKQFVSSKNKAPISNGCFKKIKHVKFSEKTNISDSLIGTRTSAYQGVRNVRFSENLACFVFFRHPFEIGPFDLLPTH